MTPPITPMTRDRGEDCLSDLTLDRLAAGELAEVPHGRETREHLAGCALCAQRHQALKLDAAAFPGIIAISEAARQTARAAAPHKTRTGLWSAGAAIAVAAIAVIVMLRGSQPGDGVRVKGGLGLAVVAKHRDGRTERLLPDAAVAAGDAIRFQISSSESGFVGVVGVDATGAVTPYIPASGALVGLASGRERLLDGAIELDASQGSERFIAVVCKRPLAIDAIVAAARQALTAAAGDPRKLPSLALDCRQDSFLVHKE